MFYLPVTKTPGAGSSLWDVRLFPLLALLCLSLGAAIARGDEVLAPEPKAEFAIRRKALEESPALANAAKAWYDLALWAAERKLEPEARAALERTIALDPDHAGARNRLGYERIGREWLPRDEAQRRKGLVFYEGRWVRPEEKARLEQGYVIDADGQWVKKEVVEARKAAEAEKARRAREFERERAWLASGTSTIEVSADTLARMLGHQKSEARATEQLLGLKFEDVERGPLLVHTTHPKDSPKLRLFLETLEMIYLEEARTYDLPVKEPIWPGKLEIYFFKEKAEFDRFATRMDAAGSACNSGGYFVHAGNVGGYPKLHIAMFDLDLGKLAHEMSHAFMSRYRLSERRVAPWVNEGVAEYVRLEISEKLKLGERDGRYRGIVKDLLRRQDPRMSLSTLMAKEEIPATEVWAYAASYAAVDFMIARDKAKFVRFLDLLKTGGDGTLSDRWGGADAPRVVSPHLWGS